MRATISDGAESHLLHRALDVAQDLRFVVDHEHARALARPADVAKVRRALGHVRYGRVGALARDGHREAERTFLVEPGALGPDLPALCLNDPSADGQPQAVPGAGLAQLVRQLQELREHRLRLALGEAAARVANRDGRVRRREDLDDRALGGELSGVAQEVIEHLPQTS
jgi:hypothetical protein